MNKRQLAAIQAIANNELSNYDGSYPSFGGNDEWDQFAGAGSLDFVDFDGTEPSAGAFPQEVKATQTGHRRMIQLVVENANSADKDFYLSEGLDHLAVGTILKDDAALVPIGGGAATIKVRGLLKDIKFFRNFFKENPTRILGFKVSSDSTLQIETNVNIEVDSPFHDKLKTRQIVLADYQNENTFRDKVVTVPEQFQLDPLTKVRMTVVANSKMTITLYVGAVLSQSKALHKMASKASSGVDYSTSMLKDKAAAYGRHLGM